MASNQTLRWTIFAALVAGIAVYRPAPVAPLPRSSQPRVVVVDWLGRGRLFAAEVTAERHGLTEVRYADGDREWVEPDRLRPWPELTGTRVSVWLRHAAQEVTVLERRGSLFHVRLDDEGDTWVSASMLYALTVGPAGQARQPQDSFPMRASVDPAEVQVGDVVLAYWMNGDSVSRARPWLCEVLALDGDSAQVRYLSDASEAAVRMQDIVRVFERGAAANVGERVWLAARTSVGTVRELRAGLVRIEAGAEQPWVDAADILGPASPGSRAPLPPGALVTALWGADAFYHGTVVSQHGDQVTLAWHDGSAPSPVDVDAILEVWSAR